MPLDITRTNIVSFHVEPWPACVPEMQDLWLEHWREVALDQDIVPLDMDLARYAEAAREGRLHLVTARRDGLMIGYLVAFVQPHLHYASTIFATCDLYYLRPEARTGWRGVTLFRVAERTLRERGAVILQAATKIHVSPVTGRTLDIGPILERLGWTQSERTFRKRLV